MFEKTTTTNNHKKEEEEKGNVLILGLHVVLMLVMASVCKRCRFENERSYCAGKKSVFR